VITGYNTEFRHGGITVHVQTEDKRHADGSFLIETLVFVGGHILASERTPYAAGALDPESIRELIDTQHRTTIARAKRGEFDHKLSSVAPSPAQPAAGGASPEPEEPSFCDDHLDRALLDCLTQEAWREHLVLEILPETPSDASGEPAVLCIRTVSSRGGAPVPEARVWVHADAPGGQGAAPLATALTDPDGRAQLRLALSADSRPCTSILVCADSSLGKAMAKWRV